MPATGAARIPDKIHSALKKVCLQINGPVIADIDINGVRVKCQSKRASVCLKQCRVVRFTLALYSDPINYYRSQALVRHAVSSSR